jgi:hypothetical protein
MHTKTAWLYEVPVGHTTVELKNHDPGAPIKRYEFEAVAGETYYFRSHVGFGLLIARFYLRPVDAKVISMCFFQIVCLDLFVCWICVIMIIHAVL